MECPDEVLAAPHVVVVGDEGAAGHHPAHRNITHHTIHYTIVNTLHTATSHITLYITQ